MAFVRSVVLWSYAKGENDLIEFIAVCLATFRVSEMLVAERGPYQILRRIRTWAGIFEVDQAGMEAVELNAIMEDSDTTPLDMPGYWAWNEVGQLLLCIWCLSVWVGLALTLIVLAGHVAAHTLQPIGYYVALPFAASAVSGLIKAKWLNG